MWSFISAMLTKKIKHAAARNLLSLNHSPFHYAKKDRFEHASELKKKESKQKKPHSLVIDISSNISYLQKEKISEKNMLQIR